MSIKTSNLISGLQNDKFKETNKKDLKIISNNIHIRLQQRNGRKSLTTIQGLNSNLDFEKINKALKKEFCCNGCVIDDPDLGVIIQLQGDQRNNIIKFLIKEEIALGKMLKIHGI
nr:translation factor sui1 [Cryptomonas curvata]|mmetsp:Transcript_23773/g.49715  ORF Transcript_23773/g.49715 Transcript_23773/m.49715 type:complete len:115 (-) Transcript_23773:6027-6371(-)